ncbi:hypothetical protein [Aquiflexum lacus]|uniref:hypothetical protein n=1 Tax=Aquiflexum lacus TaxID=2483805 RepID=UPI001895C3F9|nr:hypothetical protein [Aquiflexum lacus]
MIKLLKYRAALIGVLFGLFGGGLANLLAIEEMALYYTSLATMIALVVNLLVSFLLKGKWNLKIRNQLKYISVGLFFSLIVILITHTKFFLEGTFSYSDFDNNTSYHIKGSEYTQLAKKFKLENPYIESDNDLIREGFGSPEEKGKVWTQDSINQSWLKLLITYSLMVVFFVGLISILIEILMSKYEKTTRKSIESD